MTTVLMFVVVMAITAGLIWVMMRMERSYRQRVGRHRQAWRAGGASGLPPGSDSAADYSDGGDVSDLGRPKR